MFGIREATQQTRWRNGWWIRHKVNGAWMDWYYILNPREG